MPERRCPIYHQSIIEATIDEVSRAGLPPGDLRSPLDLTFNAFARIQGGSTFIVVLETRVGELLKRDVSRTFAVTTGCTRKDPWRMSKVKSV